MVEGMARKADKEKMFDRDLVSGIVNYDSHIGGFLYEYSDCGFVDEIFIGRTLEDAFATYCDINW